MRTAISLAHLVAIAAAGTVFAVDYGGIDFPQGSTSFADVVLTYDPSFGNGNVPTDPKYVNPARATGPPDYVPDANGTGGDFNGTGAVSLGDGGRLELLFDDNVVTNSGSSAADLAIFERGVAEAFFVAVRPANVTTRNLLGAWCPPAGFCSLGSGSWMPVGDVVQIDLDAAFGGTFGPGALRFDAVQLTDSKTQGARSGDQVGPDIDAVGGIASDAVVCGDGRVEGGEGCDDGDTEGGDGCSATCQIETCWACPEETEPSACTIDVGGPCDDLEPCTVNDSCGGALGLTCIGGPPPNCDDGNECTDDSCVTGQGCQSLPNTQPCDDGSSCSVNDQCSGGECVGATVEVGGCRTSLGTSQLRVLNRAADDLDAFVWTWTKGEQTPRSAFGNPPLGVGTFELCIFDGAPGARRLRAVASAVKAAMCGDRPCWRLKGDVGYLFKEPGASRGMRQLLLKSGVAGKARVLAKGRGRAINLSEDATMSLPVRVQLRDTSTDECWEAVYTDAIRNDASRFKAKR